MSMPSERGCNMTIHTSLSNAAQGSVVLTVCGNHHLSFLWHFSGSREERSRAESWRISLLLILDVCFHLEKNHDHLEQASLTTLCGSVFSAWELSRHLARSQQRRISPLTNALDSAGSLLCASSTTSPHQLPTFSKRKGMIWSVNVLL